jgi:hypothetical protein
MLERENIGIAGPPSDDEFGKPMLTPLTTMGSDSSAEPGLLGSSEEKGANEAVRLQRENSGV